MKNTNLFVESEIVRRLSFKAQYDVTCDLLNSNVSRAVLRSTLTHRRNQIHKICSGSKYHVYCLLSFWGIVMEFFTLRIFVVLSAWIVLLEVR